MVAITKAQVIVDAGGSEIALYVSSLEYKKIKALNYVSEMEEKGYKFLLIESASVTIEVD